MKLRRRVLELRPTQFVLGMREVDVKIEKIRAMSPKKLEDWIEEHVVPTVAGPHGHNYVIDNHHFLAACYHTGIKEVVTEQIADASAMSREAFWDFMRSKDWLYLKDLFGAGPHDPAYLPFDVRFLGDDLFRSLAWELRKADLIDKVQKPYSEFKWADFLRQKLHIDLHATTYRQAVADAIACFHAHPAEHPS